MWPFPARRSREACQPQNKATCRNWNEQSNTCTKALTSQPPPSQNIVLAQKGELREQRKSNLGECNDVFFDNNPTLKNIFPKRKISTMGELMDEVHPLVLVLCYLLACLANHTGVDFVTVLGILLTLISMISMIFIWWSNPEFDVLSLVDRFDISKAWIFILLSKYNLFCMKNIIGPTPLQT